MTKAESFKAGASTLKTLQAFASKAQGGESSSARWVRDRTKNGRVVRYPFHRHVDETTFRRTQLTTVVLVSVERMILHYARLMRPRHAAAGKFAFRSA